MNKYVIGKSKTKESNLDIASIDYTTLLETVTKKLEEGVCVFLFLKSDGETIRKAIGTRNANHIPKWSKKQVENLFEKARDLTIALGTGTTIESDFTNLGSCIDDMSPKETNSKTPNPDNVPYYDLEVQGWRSFSKQNLVAFI